MSLKAILVVALAMASVAKAEESIPLVEERVGRIELSADQVGTSQELHISPGLATLLLCDAPVARWELSGRENFRRVVEGTDTLTLLPLDTLKEGARLKLTLVFTDGAAPSRVDLMLVVHPALAQRQVELYRHARALESYQQEVRQLRAEVGRSQAEVERLRAAQSRPDGLAGLLASGVMGQEGVVFLASVADPQPMQRAAIWVTRVITIRSARRVAVQAKLESQLEVSWRFTGAALVDGAGGTVQALVVWPQEPIAARESAMGIMEFELPTLPTRGPYTLKLWAEGGTQAVTVRNITFP
ncbi:DUF2381 family protein [Corallococcus sp. ZKHCc1 1396]|uniref:DUF2381 family protein n=1 Tax=Corallococcus soli TaxID=2710757 RepID=A0ABR9PTF3_9BACT|nr:DUF2381 family protein [Corallococcus sp. BB11-1]MBE4751203.1 DUF2381 family protein [Corallococcus soli]MCY1033082.1 DUF2381 family protein [Corallococcus sp. BB11-1]